MGGRVEGMVAVVTGAARGQGASHARLLATEGAAVVLGDVIDGAGEELAAAIRALGGRAHYVHLDVTSVEDWRRAVALAEEEFGKLDCLINNAGIATYAGVVDCSTDEWESVIGVNQTGVFYGMRAVIPALRRAGGGSIVNISSIYGGVRGVGDYVAYAASKAAVIAMTKSAAVSYGPESIRVNAIAPGAVETVQMMDAIKYHQATEAGSEIEARIARQPIGRSAVPNEISQGVLFLVSKEASYVTGITLVIDGGRTI